MKSEKREIGFECFLYVHHFEIQQECSIVPESHGYNFKNKKEYQKIKGNTKNNDTNWRLQLGNNFGSWIRRQGSQFFYLDPKLKNT